MNLYLISQDENGGYDTYDSAIVAANNEDEARYTHPNHSKIHPYRWHAEENKWQMQLTDDTWADWGDDTWSHPKQVSVKHIGIATEGAIPSVILSSFNAG